MTYKRGQHSSSFWSAFEILPKVQDSVMCDLVRNVETIIDHYYLLTEYRLI